MKERKKKVSAMLACSLMMNMIASSGMNAKAIDANQAASGNLDELNRAIVDCSLIKHYISGDMGFTEHTSDEFKKRLDYDGNGVINIYDEMKAKAIIFEYAGKQNESTTSVSESSAASSTTVTTASASEYTNPSSLKVGDKVYYKGDIHGSSTGSGKAVPVENYYVITKILDGTNPYRVQLSNLGWVAYNDVAGKKWTVSITESTTAPVTTVPNSSKLKIGDKISYSGTVYQSSTGTGKSAQLPSGIYEIADIIASESVPYRVQLKNYGWIAYKDAEGKQVAVTTAATTTTAQSTTAATTTTAVTTTTKATSASTNPSVLKKGDKISYSGPVYQSSSGAGKAAQLPSGTYEIADIITTESVPYRVQLKNYGWIAYDAAAGKQVSATTAAVTTTVTKATTAATNPSVLKEGGKISYSGTVYQSSSGAGKAAQLPSGTYEIADIITTETVPYRVQLKNYGWVAYKDITGYSTTPAVTTAQTTQQTSVSSGSADFNNSKIKIKNSYSGKYLSAVSTSDESNVFQLSSDSSKNQVLTVKNYYNTDSIRLYFNDKQVIDIVKNETSEEAKKITAGCNVEVYNDCDVNAQLFKLVKVNDNAYKIVSASNPSVCLTVNGNSDGSNNGISQTASGNIYLSDYSGKSEQLWIIEKV